MSVNAPTPVANNPRGVSVASLAAGIISVIVSLLPFAGFLFGVPAVIFGILGLKSKKNRAWAKAGIIIASVGILISIIVSTLFVITVASLELPNQA